MYRYNASAVYNICDEFTEDVQEVWADIAQGYALLGIYNTSARAYKNALFYNDKNPSVLYGLGRLYIAKRDFIAARNIMSILENNENEQFKTHVLKGHYYLKKNDVDKSYISFYKACNICNEYDSYFLYGLGLFYEAINNYDQAGKIYLRHYNQYNFYELNTDLLFRLGMINKCQNNSEIALRIFNILLQMNELKNLNKSDISLQIAHLYEKKNDHKIAIEILEYIINKTKTHRFAIALLCWIYYKDNKYDEILQIPNIMSLTDPYVFYILGRTFFELENYKESFEMYKKAILLDRSNPWFWNSIGILYYKNEQYQEAKGKFETGYNIDNNFAEVKHNLALCSSSKDAKFDELQDVIPDIEFTPYIKSQVFLGDPAYKIDKNKIGSYVLPIENMLHANME